MATLGEFLSEKLGVAPAAEALGQKDIIEYNKSGNGEYRHLQDYLH